MQLPYDLVNKFAQVTVENPYAYDNKDVAEYGTIKEVNGKYLVQIDGSNIMTPFISVSDVKDEERVKVEVIGHQAIVTGNMTNPSIGVKTANDKFDQIDGDITDLDIKTQDALAGLRKEAEEERKRIEEELTKKVEEAKQDAAEADEHAKAAAKVSTDYIEAKPGDGFYVGTSETSEYHVHINAGGIQIRKGYSNPLVLSKWDASQLVIGQSDKFHSTMKLNEFNISQNNQTYMSLGLTGMTLNDAHGVPYAKYTTTGFTLGYETGGTGVHLVGTNTAFQFYKEKTLLTEFALNRIQIGPNSNKNIVMDTNGVFLRNNTTNISKFTENSISFASGNGTIEYDTSNTYKVPWAGEDKFPGLKLTATNEKNACVEIDAKKDVLIHAYRDTARTTEGAILLRSNDGGFSFNTYGQGLRTTRMNSSWFSVYGGASSFSDKDEDGNVFYYDTRMETKNLDWILFANPRWVTFRGSYNSYNHGDEGGDFESFSVWDCNNISLSAHQQVHLKASLEGVWLEGKTIWLTSNDVLYKGTSLWNIFALKDHTHVATAALYSAQLDNSAAITSLYENQLRQDEMITQLYEQTL